MPVDVVAFVVLRRRKVTERYDYAPSDQNLNMAFSPWQVCMAYKSAIRRTVLLWRTIRNMGPAPIADGESDGVPNGRDHFSVVLRKHFAQQQADVYIIALETRVDQPGVITTCGQWFSDLPASGPGEI